MVFLHFGVPFIYGKFARLSLKRKAKKFNALVLTFDDGPGTRLTTRILEILAQYDVKATFFVLGRNIPGREAVVRHIVAAGHEIGSHGYEHLHYWRVSPFRALMSIKRGERAIDVALGTSRRVYPFRPPYGKLDFISLLYLLVRKVPIVYWTLDLGDTWSSGKPDGQRVADLAKESGGAIVLAHDFDRSDDHVHGLVLESIRLALAMARKTNMQTLTCSQLLTR